MGLLVEGEALPPEELTQYLNFIREHGITQFLCVWNRYVLCNIAFLSSTFMIIFLIICRVKDIKDDELRFGDEVECGIFVIDRNNKTVKIALRGAEVSYLIFFYFELLKPYVLVLHTYS